MDILELGAIGELVGGVAVIASLLYVGLQVRQSTQATRAASYQATVDSFREWSRSIIEDPDVADVFLRGNMDQSGLSQRESVQYGMLLFGAVRIWETLFYQSQTGTGERGLLRAEEGSLRWLLSNPGVQEWWRETPFSLNDEFTEYIESFVPPSPARNEGV